MKNYTIIPNELLDSSPLPIQARYLLCVLRRFAGQDENCYPSQHRLSRALGISERQIRSYLRILEMNDFISKKRRGFNKSNTYTINSEWRKPTSGHLGSPLPSHTETQLPPKITYRKSKNKRGLELIRETLERRGLKQPEALSKN